MVEGIIVGNHRCPCANHVGKVGIESACKTTIEVLFNLFDRVTVDKSSLIQCGKLVKNV